MTDIDSTLMEKSEVVGEKKLRLWPVALVILLVVFVPALIAWCMSMMAYN